MMIIGGNWKRFYYRNYDFSVHIFTIFFELECVCNPLGVGDPAISRLCDKNTGICKCKNIRIGGAHCDRCAEGYEGPFPNCMGI